MTAKSQVEAENRVHRKAVKQSGNQIRIPHTMNVLVKEMKDSEITVVAQLYNIFSGWLILVIKAPKFFYKCS